MMLNKGECESALISFYRNVPKIDESEYEYEYEVLKKLIEEHFELVEEYKDCRRELEDYYELMLDE